MEDPVSRPELRTDRTAQAPDIFPDSKHWLLLPTRAQLFLSDEKAETEDDSWHRFHEKSEIDLNSRRGTRRRFHGHTRLE